MLLMRSVRPVLVVFLSLSLLFPCVSSGLAIGIKRGDLIPPIVTHTPLTEFAAGMPIRIQAMATDNVGVSDVTLSYREVGSNEFKRVKMLEAPGQDIYSVDLPMIAGARIEYFIQATDQAGNIAPEQLVEPYVIMMPPVAVVKTDIGQPPDPAAAQQQASKKDGVNKWVWVGVGVVAVGALLSGGGGGGGNGDTGPSGTVTITGPIP